MDQTTSIQLTKTPQSHWKKKWGYYVLPTLVLIMATWYGGYLKLFALSNPYAPGATLDPACAPGDPNCTVQVIPDQASQGGKILSTDGSTTLWKTETGGDFNGNQVISRSGLPGANTAAGAGGTTLKDFIQNYFFPAQAPGATSISIAGGNSRETGASTTVALSWTVTRTSSAITTITLQADSGGTVCGGSANTITSVTSGSCATTITGNTQSGSSMPATTTTSVSRTNGGTTTFSLRVSDGTLSAGPTAVTLTYSPKVYIWKTTYDYLSNPSSYSDATISSDFVNGTSSTTCSGSPIALPCNLLTTTTARTFQGVLSNEYIYYAVPVNIAGSLAAYRSTAFLDGLGSAISNGIGRKLVSNFTNASSYTQQYYIYEFRSSDDAHGDGGTTGTTKYTSS